MILTCLVFRWICTRCGISIRVIFSLISVGAVMLNVVFLAWLHYRTNALNDIALDLDTLTAALPDLVVLRSLDPRLENIMAQLLPAITINKNDDGTGSSNHLRLEDAMNPRIFLRFDEAAPKEVEGMSRSHWLPNAIPNHRLIPEHLLENEEAHKQRRTNTSTPSFLGEKGRKPFYSKTPDSGTFNWDHSYESDHRALYLYNPSVLPLDPNDPDPLSDQDWLALTGGDVQVHYLATFRANTGGNCFGSDKPGVMRRGEQISYLAVALLDENLDLIPNTDVLIDINAGPSTGKYFLQFAEDCKPTRMRGNLYFMCNEQLFRVVIRRKVAEGNPIAVVDGRTLHTGSDRKIPYIYPNIHGDGLEITLLARQKIAGGKNLNFFRAPSTSHTNRDTGQFEYYLQVFPLPHRYHRLIVPPATKSTDGAKVRKEPEQKSIARLPPPSFDGPDTANTITTCPENERPGSGVWITNCTQPEERPFFSDRDHGTACCVTVSLPGGDVMVGISHTKTSGILNPWWLRDIHGRYRGDGNDNNYKIGGKRYLSRFVAYDPMPPFDIVARSGWFCLGFAARGETGGNTLAGRNVQYRMDLFATRGSSSSNNDTTFACPMVHFASGIAEFLGDSSKAIISYGVADCHPRMIVVEKEDIAKRLLGIL